MSTGSSSLDPPWPPGPAMQPGTETILQRFTVACDYPVAFTAHLFDPANPLLAETLGRIEPEKRHRCLVFLDDGLAACRPGLAEEINAYARHHATRMELVAPPVPVPGGEVVKNDLHFVERMQR